MAVATIYLSIDAGRKFAGEVGPISYTEINETSSPMGCDFNRSMQHLVSNLYPFSLSQRLVSMTADD